MLYIVIDINRGRNPGVRDEMNKTWHIGESLVMNEILLDCVKMVQADCDELEYLKEQISGIPFNKKRVQQWFGDDAKFIVGTISK